MNLLKNTCIILLCFVGFSFSKNTNEIVWNKMGVSSTKMQVLRFKVTIIIPPNTFPKKSSFEITPSAFGYAFKTISIQGIKAYGNGQTIADEPGATFLYSDYIPFSAEMRDAKFVGNLSIRHSKKNSLIDESSVALKQNEEVYYYLNDDKTSFFSFKAEYSFELL